MAKTKSVPTSYTARKYAEEHGITVRQARRVLTGTRTLEHAKGPAREADRRRLEAIARR